jgi:hypothetical protein
MDYNSLVADLQTYTDRTDAGFVAAIPGFINKAMERIYKDLKSVGFEIVVDTNLTINTAIYAKPANWKGTISFQITDNATNKVFYILPRSLEFCKSYWPNPVQTGVPKFYADSVGYTNFYIVPTPNANYAGQIIYKGLPLFNAENPVNFITQRYENLLLFESLRQSVIFLKDDEREAFFEAQYKKSLAGAAEDQEYLINDRTSRRDKD